MRSTKIFTVDQPGEWWVKACTWASQQKFCAFTNHNDQKFPFSPFKKIIAAGGKKFLAAGQKDDFEALKIFHQENQDWLFGYFGYDLKNQIEPQLFSSHASRTSHPDLFLFIPEHLVFFEGLQVRVESAAPEKIITEIESCNHTFLSMPQVDFKNDMSESDYLKKASSVIDNIIDGDVYELNLCMDFFASDVKFDPLSAYLRLTDISPTPFSGFLKFNDHYLISASPERFLKKEGKNLLSQPIKGTAARHPDKKTDEYLKDQLHNNEKERAENMMIVDLVRNDLARSAEYGSVQVEEMFKVYSFKQWHQMISTVSAVARENVHWVDIIKNAFPMGSMTGAPKIKAMELIEKYENSRRGVFSSAFGYITPDGDFDLNVVIRSIFYNSGTQIINFMVGSALTYDAIPEKEYEECLLKASAIFQLFNYRTKS